ncbi:transcription antitermination factor NusB [Microcella alkalica]|uniref:16S rRNA (Cytosine967-C5)-methyltransferase n=1 Tax=Microcella alkalica TaxID=355930 RepID=A0A839ECM7_9MICO|nr:16S rRNA (cytosine967-C5)-methyltransferase [Microcella alkalica]
MKNVRGGGGPRSGGAARGGEPGGSGAQKPSPSRTGAPVERPARRSRPPATARGVALEVVRAVARDDAYANLLLPVAIRRARLGSADAGLATELAYGTLRRRGLYDAIIVEASGRGLDRIDADALDVLRLGAHQLLAMRVPAHAAVGETVELSRAIGAHRATGFINAVLRRIAQRSEREWVDVLLAHETDPDARLAIETAHPAWVVSALRSALEREGRGGELPVLLAADNVSPRVTLVALPGIADIPPELETARTRHSPLGYLSPSGDPAADPEVAAGRVRVQDEGSQLAALALSRARPVAAGEHWLDLCAGPGGKAALLAAEAIAGGATLVANEVVPARAELVRKALAPLGDGIEVRTSDGRTVGATDPGRFDRILLDAPCTGLGALRRRPEARWRKTEADVPSLAALQAELLEAAIGALRPGGLLAYVTCSPHPAETTEVVDRVLAGDAATAAGVRRVDTAGVLADVVREALDLGELDGAVQLWPHRHGGDAMFIQLLERSATDEAHPLDTLPE